MLPWACALRPDGVPYTRGAYNTAKKRLTATEVALPWPDADAYRKHFHTELIPPTARHESSMLQDLRAGRRTEIEALCGAVERLGRELGIDTPVVSALATLVRAAEQEGGAPGGVCGCGADAATAGVDADGDLRRRPSKILSICWPPPPFLLQHPCLSLLLRHREKD